MSSTQQELCQSELTSPPSLTALQSRCLRVSPQTRQLSALCEADIVSGRPMRSLTVFLNCSPIYVVNRDDGEVETMLADFKKSALDTFRPECIHVKTPEQAADLPAPAYM